MDMLGSEHHVPLHPYCTVPSLTALWVPQIFPWSPKFDSALPVNPAQKATQSHAPGYSGE